jgi:hypothetical protein
MEKTEIKVMTEEPRADLGTPKHLLRFISYYTGEEYGCVP